MQKRKMIKVLALSVVGVSILGIGATSASAISNRTRAEKLSELTGKPTEEIISEKFESGKTYGEIAEENGVLEEFRDYHYEEKKNIVQENIDSGLITDEEGQKTLKYLAEQQANCDGTGSGIHASQQSGYSHSDNHYDYYHSGGSYSDNSYTHHGNGRRGIHKHHGNSSR